jgi:dihydrodipicolinate synthase/N-acetylneuraminate lyase
MVAELARHPNIIGIKDSSGNMERMRATVELTRTAPRRTVTVTPVFEAVTARMLEPKVESTSPLVFAGDLANGMAVATLPPSAPIKTRTKEVGFQVLTGSASHVLQSLEFGAAGAILGFGACAPQACTEIHLAWKERDPALAAEKQQRIAAASRRITAELGIAGVKYACDFNGYYGGWPRAPLLPLTAGQKSEIENLLAEIRN